MGKSTYKRVDRNGKGKAGKFRIRKTWSSYGNVSNQLCIWDRLNIADFESKGQHGDWCIYERVTGAQMIVRHHYSASPHGSMKLKVSDSINADPITITKGRSACAVTQYSSRAIYRHLINWFSRYTDRPLDYAFPFARRMYTWYNNILDIMIAFSHYGSHRYVPRTLYSDHVRRFTECTASAALHGSFGQSVARSKKPNYSRLPLVLGARFLEKTLK